MIIARTKMIGLNILCFLAGMAVAMFFSKILKWGVIFIFVAVVLAAVIWWAKQKLSSKPSVD